MENHDMRNWIFADSLYVKNTEYDGQWVMIKDAKVVAHGNKPDIFTKCRDRYPDESMLLVKIPSADDLIPMIPFKGTVQSTRAK